MPELNENIVESINTAKEEYGEEFKKQAKEFEEVKEGLISEEEAAESMGAKVYNSIMTSSLEILNLPEIQKQLDILKEQLDSKSCAALVGILAINAAHAAYHAIILHDNLLKEELIKQFDSMVNHINQDKKLIGLTETRVSVLEAKLNKLMEENLVNKATKETI